MGFAFYTWCFLSFIGTIHGLAQMPLPGGGSVQPSGETPTMPYPLNIPTNGFKNAIRLPSAMVHKTFRKGDMGCTDLANEDGKVYIEPTPKCSSPPHFMMPDDPLRDYIWYECFFDFPRPHAFDGKQNDCGCTCCAYDSKYGSAENAKKSNDPKAIVMVEFGITKQQENNTDAEPIMNQMKNIKENGSRVSNIESINATKWITKDMNCRNSSIYQASSANVPSFRMMVCDEVIAGLSEKQMNEMKSVRGNGADSNVVLHEPTADGKIMYVMVTDINVEFIKWSGLPDGMKPWDV